MTGPVGLRTDMALKLERIMELKASFPPDPAVTGVQAGRVAIGAMGVAICGLLTESANKGADVPVRRTIGAAICGLLPESTKPEAVGGLATGAAICGLIIESAKLLTDPEAGMVEVLGFMVVAICGLFIESAKLFVDPDGGMDDLNGSTVAALCADVSPAEASVICSDERCSSCRACTFCNLLFCSSSTRRIMSATVCISVRN